MDYTAKIKITEELLWKLFPAVNSKRGRANKAANIKGFVYTFNKYADFFGIDTALEVRHFLAQFAVESDQWNAFREYASGAAYEGRSDLGNVIKGDGVRFPGRGGLQTTGRTNYTIAGRQMLKLPFLTAAEKALFEKDGILKHPELLEDPVWGTLSSFIYWTDKDLNSLCRPDNETVIIKRFNGSKWYNYACKPIEAITRKVNGGLNGFPERVKFYNLLSKSISCS